MLRGTDDCDNLVDVIESDKQTAQNVGTRLGFLQPESRPSIDDL
jgi:hypothetical protein